MTAYTTLYYYIIIECKKEKKSLKIGWVLLQRYSSLLVV